MEMVCVAFDLMQLRSGFVFPIFSVWTLGDGGAIDGRYVGPWIIIQRKTFDRPITLALELHNWEINFHWIKLLKLALS